LQIVGVGERSVGEVGSASSSRWGVLLLEPIYLLLGCSGGGLHSRFTQRNQRRGRTGTTVEGDRNFLLFVDEVDEGDHGKPRLVPERRRNNVPLRLSVK